MISIIIPTYNHLEDCLKPCLESIKRYTDLENVEVIVVANGCTDGTKDYVESLGEPFRLLWIEEPSGYTKSTNEGIKIAKGNYIILLNNDTVLIEQEKNTWIKMLSVPFEEHEDTGITGPLMLYDEYAGYNVLIFFCVMIKKELIDKIGLLDESYSPGGGEDIDYCIKAEHNGYKCIKIPENESIQFTTTNTGSFPIYHAGEGTFNGIPEYGNRIIKENGLKNLKKYNKNIRLNIGSGGIEIPGYISVDKLDLRANIIMDACELDFEENSIEEIIAVHLFEHISPYQAHSTLSKWAKILKPGKKLIMEIPNIEELCKNFEKSDKLHKYNILNCIYGSTNTITENPREITSPHLWGWYPEILQDHLLESGFTNIIFLPEQHPHPGYNMRVECEKPIEKKEPIYVDTGETTITACVSTKNRYNTTLPICIMAIANQTRKPDKLLIIDDGEKKNLNEDPLYLYLFSLLDQKNIPVFVLFGQGKGIPTNHQMFIDCSETNWIWRIDDDEAPEPNVLEELVNCIEPDVGAIASLVLDPKEAKDLPNGLPNNRIEGIRSEPNIQWFRHKNKEKIEVDHLYSTFLFRKSAAKHGACLSLSPVGHREETIFSHEMKKNGWKIIVTPNAITWHFRNPEGGLREFQDPSLWDHDEKVFNKKLEIWNIKDDSKLIVLNNGLGDHLSFINILPEIIEKYKEVSLAVCYPEPFEDFSVKLLSISDAMTITNGKLEQYDIYKWMQDRNWEENIVDAYRGMYL